MALPLCVGVILLVYSWYLSYPLSIDSVYDFIFNHISPLYWLGLALLLASLYVIAAMSESGDLKFMICAGIVTCIYSLSYFYYSLPGSDIHYYGGLTEYLIKTGDLNPSKPYHDYFQWPLFYILNKMGHSITGLELIHLEFLLYAILGFLYVASFYTYASRFFKGGGYLAVIAYFIVMQIFLNYQFAPFSLAFAFVVLLFILDTHTPEKIEATLTTMIVFTTITFSHPYAPVFFIIYELVMYITGRRKKHLSLFLFTLCTYLTVNIYFTATFFPGLIIKLTSLYMEQYPIIVERVFSASVAPAPVIDTIARTFSRATVLSTAAISFLGFLLLWRRRKLRRVDSAIFLSAASYSAVGTVLSVLGQRGFYFIFIPISLGATYFLTGKFGKHYKCLFLVLMILSAFIPLHNSFYDAEIMFQTREAYVSANFMINHYNWVSPSSVLSHFRFMHYLQVRTTGNVSFGHDLRPDFPDSVRNYDCIVYTVGLGKSFLLNNYSVTELLGESEYNRVFDSGFSYVATRTNSSYDEVN